MNTLADSFGRRFSYLRLSVTDACNFKCQYCLPNGYQKRTDEGFLEASEIRLLIEGFAEAGTKKIRLTGGEPTLRQDLPDIAFQAFSTPGIECVALSTNGWNLKSQAAVLKQAGVSRINVSADSLDTERFEKMTGSKRLPQILDGIDEALALDFETVKINAVLMRENFQAELANFQEFVRLRPVSVRFIELMPTLDNRKLFESQHLKAEDLRQRLLRDGWQLVARGRDDGPAAEYRHDDFKGRIGLIAPYGKDFCGSCNRLRVTSRGALRLCLFGDGDHSLRAYLQRAEDRPALHAQLQQILTHKKVSHFLKDGLIGDNRSFSAMGG